MSERRGQPPIFWVGIALAAVALLILVFRLTTIAPERAGPMFAGVVAGLVIAVLIIGGFVWSIAARMRWTAERFPRAVRIPIVTGSELAGGTARLAAELHADNVRLKPSKYAAIAVDSEGVHVISSTDQVPGLVPASSVAVTGLSRVLLGFREFDAIVLTVTTEAGSIDLPITPMRLKGNVLRALTSDEVQSVAKSIDEALKGRVPQPGWPY